MKRDTRVTRYASVLRLEASDPAAAASLADATIDDVARMELGAFH